MRIFNLLIILLFSFNSFAAPTCRGENQWKCDLFTKYDKDENALIQKAEIVHLYFKVFKEKFATFVINKNPNIPDFALKQVEVALFKYYLKHQDIPELRSFENIWKFIRFILRGVRFKIEMDFSDFILLLDDFQIEEDSDLEV